MGSSWMHGKSSVCRGVAFKLVGGQGYYGERGIRQAVKVLKNVECQVRRN